MKKQNRNRMEDMRELTTWGLTILVIVFTMAIYGHSDAPTATVSEKESVKIELPQEHPGGYELMMASIENYE